jgi:spectinomycin phosphotransferase
MTESPSAAKDRPRVRDDALVECLRERYDLSPASVEFLPLGYDAAAWVYRVTTHDGATYFLKLKRGIERPNILRVPHYLREHGVPQVVAPLATTSGELWTSLGDVALILYPYVEGTSGLEAGLTLAQWTKFGAILRAVHAAALPEEIARTLPREAFRPDSRYRASALAVASSEDRAPADAISAELTAFLSDKRAVGERVVQRCDELGAELRARCWDFVFCHADIHVANVMIDVDGHVVIVDWDQPVYAPKERDLMFVLGPALNGFDSSSPQEAAFVDGYGRVEIDSRALVYYRYAWAVEDIGSFAAEILRPIDPGDGSRRRALAALRGSFGANGIVAEALRSDDEIR